MRLLALVAATWAVTLVGCGGPQTSLSDLNIVGGQNVPTDQADLRAKATVALTTELGPEDLDSPLDSGKSFCSGTIISERVILTAAHCVQKFNPETNEKFDELNFPYERDFLVSFGNSVARDGAWGRAQQVIPHPEWSPSETLTRQPTRAPDDIALIVLAEPVPTGTQIAEIASSEIDLKELQAHLVGFGVTTSRDSNDTGVMRQVSVEVSDQDADTKRFTVGELFRGACAGDSGGPAYFEIDGRLQVAGATSTGAEMFGMCLGQGNNYTDARLYAEWIEQEVGEFM